MTTNRLGISVCCVLAAAGMYSTLHAEAGPTLLAPIARAESCPAGQELQGGQCVEPSLPAIHVDAAPAYACLTAQGELGDRLEDDVCVAGNGTTGTAGGGNEPAVAGVTP